MRSVIRALVCGGSLCLGATAADAVALGATDTFEDGSTNGWGSGAVSPVPPVNVAGGGPAGAGDRYLLATATGGAGAGGRLVVIGGTQWTGNYGAAGVDAITMDARNLGPTEISLRLAVFGAGSSLGVSLTPVVLAAGGGWQAVSFSLAPSALAGATLPTLDAISGLRLFHSSAAQFPGDATAAQLGLDNVTAVPEPASTALMACGLAMLLARRWRHPNH